MNRTEEYYLFLSDRCALEALLLLWQQMT